MSKTIRLTESDLVKIVKRTINTRREFDLLEQNFGSIARKATTLAGKSSDEISSLLKTTEKAVALSIDDIVRDALKTKSISSIDDIQAKLMHFYNPSGLAENVPQAKEKLKNFLNGYAKSRGDSNWQVVRDKVSGKPTQNASQSTAQATSQAASNTYRDAMKGQRVSNRWYGWKPENIDFTKFSNKMSFDDLNKSIANAIQTKNWNLIPRAGFEKLGIPNFREYLQNNIAKINEIDPTTGRWSVIFK